MKNILSFDKFNNLDKVTEEISDEFITKNLNDAREKGRAISPGYEQNVRIKNANLNKEEEKRVGQRKHEDRLKKAGETQKIVSEINNEYMNDDTTYKIESMDNLKFETRYFPDSNLIAFGFSLKNTLLYKIDYKIDEDKISFIKRIKEEEPFRSQPLSDIMVYIPFISKIFKKYFPESKYADRRIWSSLE